MKSLPHTNTAVLACALALLFAIQTAGRLAAQESATGSNIFAFITAGDMRNFTVSAHAGERYFDGLCEAAKKIGPGEFMISPGDCDPPAPIRAVIDRVLGTNFLWYPVVGNHDADSSKDMAWFHHWAEAGIPHLVRHGPPGVEDATYSFDYANSHFIVLDEYYNGKSDAVGNGDVADAALKWLADDLDATKQPLIWVTGHKPIKSLPDMDSGRVRHDGDSITANPKHRERFLALLNEHHVRAYICGHTHNASVAKVEGVWQLDSGHARGAGDTGSPSTFLKVRVEGLQTWVEIRRSDAKGVEYRLERTQKLE